MTPVMASDSGWADASSRSRPTRSMKTMVTAATIQPLLSLQGSLDAKREGIMRTSSRMPHPRISVVIKVAMERTAISLWISHSSSVAPKVPIRKPSTFTRTMTMAANSAETCFFRHRSTVMVMVSSVNRSESLIPTHMHTTTATTCSSASRWMIYGALTFSMGIKKVFQM